MIKNKISNFFEIKKNNSSFSKEFLAGLTTFISMAYIVSVHPSIISQTGMPFNACVTSTVLVCFFSSMMMALYARNPVALAPGLGLNSFFTFTLVLQMNIPYEQALGATFWTGILFFILSVFKIRKLIIQSIPASLQKAMGVGIGLFIAFIGLIQGEWIAHTKNSIIERAPFTIENIIFIISLLITIFLVTKKVKGSFLISILITTLLCWPLGRWFGEEKIIEFQGWLAWPDFSLVGKMDLLGSLHLSLLPTIFSLVFVDFFESIGTFMALFRNFNLMDSKGEPRRFKENLITDAWGTAFAGFFGSSAATTYLESGTGLKEGGRTGLSALVTAFLFLPLMFFSPLISMIPAVATAPILIIVGFFMMKIAKEIKWDQMEESIPAFLIILLIPLFFSITQGILWGLLTYIFVQIIQGKKISLVLLLTGMACLASIMIESWFYF